MMIRNVLTQEINRNVLAQEINRSTFGHKG